MRPREAMASAELPRHGRLLVVQTQRMGDVLCATPVFHALRTARPGVQICALVHSPNQVLLEGSPDVDDVLVYNRKTTHRTIVARLRLLLSMRRGQYSGVLVLHAARSVAFAIAHSGIPWRAVVWRYGPRMPPAWAASYQHHVRQDRMSGTRHEIEHNLEVLRALGVSAAPDRYRLYLGEGEAAAAREAIRALGRDPSRPLAVVHPGHGGGRVVWPAASHAALVRGLGEQGYQVAVTGVAAERELVAAVCCEAGSGAWPLAGALSLRQLACLLREARVFVGVPTGPMHLASAVGTPVVTLYGPAALAIDRTRFCAYGSPCRAVVSPVRCPCPSPGVCTDAVCMAGIEPAAVLAAVEQLTRGQESEQLGRNSSAGPLPGTAMGVKYAQE
jgi:ADP-heptose:LPS heptosyltransferase